MALRALTLSRCAPRPLPHSLTRPLSRSRFSTQPEPIRLRNSLSGGSQTLAFPSDSSDSSTSGRSLSWYACGPTVYDSSHIGHARTYINTDIIRRVLTDHFKIHVNFAMGMTDIDNKIINRAKEQCGSGSGEGGECVSGDVEEVPGWLRLARKYEASFLADMDALHVRRPGAILRVTEHLDEIKDYIATIMAAGKAYETSSGVYFSVPRHSSTNGKYGKLGNIPSSGSTSPLPAIEEAVNSALEDQDIGVVEETVGSPSDKQDPRDFALWKRVDAEHATAEGEPYWDSPWGPGRPGWHIECSAVTHSHFGTSLDVHSGGIDLRFPHHTNEIAQWYVFLHVCDNNDKLYAEYYVSLICLFKFLRCISQRST
jgi:cysteinyl-tRNA synthetase